MTAPEPLFREEAVDYARRGQGTGDVVRVAPRWTAIAFWSLLALIATALVTATVVRVDRVRLVPAVADPGTGVVRAAVPEQDAPRPGDRAEFALTRTGDRAPVRVVAVRPPQRGVVAVTARAEGALPSGAGVLELKVGERRLIADLVPGSAAER